LREEEMQTEFVANRKEGMSERGSFARSFNPKMHCAFDVYLRYDIDTDYIEYNLGDNYAFSRIRDKNKKLMYVT